MNEPPEIVLHLPIEDAPWLELRPGSDDPADLQRLLDWVATEPNRRRLAAVIALATGETYEP